MATERVDIQVRTHGVQQARAGLSSLRNLAAGLGVTFGALALGRQFVSTVNLLKEFEFNMARVKAISGATEEEFRALSKTARTLGATTIFSAKQAASGMALLAQAGFSANEVIDATASSLQLAQAGALELREAADLTAKAIRGYGLEASEAGRIADTLAKLSARANTDVSQFGESMKFAAASSRSLGIDLEQTAAVVGILSDNSVQAGMAGTGFRQFLIKLIRPSQEARDVLRENGIALDELAKSLSDPVKLIRLLEPVLTDAGKAARIFSSRALNAALILGRNADAVEDLTEELRNSTGFAEKFAAIMGNTLFGSMRALISSFQELQLRAGDAGLAGGLKNLIFITGGVISSYNGMQEEFVQANRLSKEQEERINQVRIAIDGLIGSLKALTVLYGLSIVRSVGLSVAKGGILSVLTGRAGLIAAFALLGAGLSTNIDRVNKTITGYNLLQATLVGIIDTVKGVFTGQVSLTKAYSNAVDVATEYLNIVNKQKEVAAEQREEEQKLLNTLKQGADQRQALTPASDDEDDAEDRLAARIELLKLGEQELAQRVQLGTLSVKNAALIIDSLNETRAAQDGLVNSTKALNEAFNGQFITTEKAEENIREISRAYQNQQSFITLVNEDLVNLRKELDAGNITAEQFRERSALLEVELAEIDKTVQGLSEGLTFYNKVIDENTRRTRENTEIAIQLRDVKYELEQLGEGGLAASVASSREEIENAKRLVSVFEDVNSARDKANQSLKDTIRLFKDNNMSLEEARVSKEGLRDAIELLGEDLEGLIEKQEIVNQLLRDGKIGTEAFRRAQADLAEQIEETTEQKREYESQFKSASDTVERETEKQKEAIEQLIDALKSVIDLINEIAGHFTERAQVEGEIANLETRRQKTLELLNQERAKDKPSDTNINNLQRDLLKIQQDINDNLNKLDTTLGSGALVRKGGALALDVGEKLVESYLENAESFNTGGIVPGRGPQPIIAHGQEAIFNPKQLDNLNSLVGMQRGGNINLSIYGGGEGGIEPEVGYVRKPSGDTDVEVSLSNVIKGMIKSGELDSSLLSRYSMRLN